MLWLGASQVYGINGYRPPERTVAYRVFDTLIQDGVAVLAVTFPLASPQEHLIALQYLIDKLPISGLIVGAAFGDMRHDVVRADIDRLLDEGPARERLRTANEAGPEIARSAPGPSNPAIAQPVREASLADRSEALLTRTLEACCGLETFREAGRAWVVLWLQDLRRSIESLRARLTRDLSRYRILMVERHYANNWEAWRKILATTRTRNIPTMVYVAPRPTDFFPFDPAAYAAFKRDLAALAAEQDAGFVNIEDAVLPNERWGMVDIAFGFYARDPFHFSAEGHAQMADALLPHIRRHIVERGIAP